MYNARYMVRNLVLILLINCRSAFLLSVNLLYTTLGAICFFTAFFAQSPGVAIAEDNRYDVIIIGGGTSGVAAAIQAGRLGAKVALFEETDWIGGQMTAAGVSNMDEGGYPPSGIYKEFLDKIETYYRSLTPRKSLGTCYFDSKSNCFEPGIARKIFIQMIEETRALRVNSGHYALLDTYLMTKVSSVLKRGHTVIGIVTDNRSKYYAKVVIDATECGDIIPLTGSRYRAGNLTSDQINDPTFKYEGPDYKNASIQSITYSAIIKKFPQGIPEQLWIKTPPPGYDDQVKKIFRSRVTNESNAKGVWSWVHHSGYRGMPNSEPTAPDASADSLAGRNKISKTGLNYANDYPWLKNLDKNLYTDISDPYPLSVRYLLDHSFREEINCKAKLRTLQFIYYVQNELNQPWAIAQEEGYYSEYNKERNNCQNIPESRTDLKTVEGFMPVMPYVREGIRIIGVYTLTAKDIKRVGYFGEDTPPFSAEKLFNDSVVAIGDYAVDMHGAGHNKNLESYLGESWKDKPSWRYGPFHIPFECLIPETTDGFMTAEKNISVTRMASAAIRLQPTTMRVGQAIGIVAALAARNNIQPRNVNPVAVQWELLKNQIPLYIVSDAPETGFLFYNDVPQNHPLWKEVQMVGLRNMMASMGQGKFGVDAPLTRTQLANILARLNEMALHIGSRSTDADSLAGDVRNFILKSYLKIKAYLAGSQKPVTRSRFVEMIADIMKPHLETASATPFFSDVPPSHPAFKYIQIMAANNLLGVFSHSADGKPVFDPKKQITRGEAAAVLTAIVLKH